ncbi:MULTISPECIES: helix-turn-helix domain-containing protein [unclassified Roseovarius]|uniref:winged helix-turn-helix transcriptional regulator n=1 Tax=unclassified Roseovarius TaxID=2614913 RepID=UPI00273D8E03|nr:MULTISPECIES: helix-turn-helix domain-containing protein [unclassified Roseovarius]
MSRVNHLDIPDDAYDFRSRCSIARSLDLIGDKWTLLIIRDLMWHEKSTFQALQRSEERVPSNILANRLKRLVELGLVGKTPYQDRPVRYRYALTEVGRSLEPVLLSLMAWGHGNLGGGQYDPSTGESKLPS